MEQNRWFCKNCDRHFTSSRRLKQHTSTIHNRPSTWVCEACAKSFCSAFNLKRHRSRVHNHRASKWVCKVCARNFSSAFSLSRHRSSIHNHNPTSSVECEHCQKHFTCKSSILRHIKVVHGGDKDPVFQCHDCGKKYLKKYSLLVHISKTHLLQNIETNFECNDCGKRFEKKASLSSHISITHMKTTENFECSICSQTFQAKKYLRRHLMRNRCNGILKTANDFKCLLCNHAFHFKRAVQNHYEKVHDIDLKTEVLHFSSFDLFQEWKKEMEHDTLTHYTKQTTKKSTSHTTMWYYCHRSGTYVDRRKGQKRMHCLKMYGSKKLNGWCPAELIVKMKPDGNCFVNLLKTHLGHNVCDKIELRHLYFDKEEIDDIVTRLVTGVPPTEMQIQQFNSCENYQHPDDRSDLTLEDIHNIVTDNNVRNKDAISGTNDEQCVISFIEQNEDSVLYFKFKDTVDDKYPELKKTDFVMVIMNKMQQDCLMKYGFRVVSLGTRKSNPCSFILHTLLVLDVDMEDVPVAFILSNRDDTIIIDVFLRCLKERVGIISPRTVITDMSPIYINSWMKWMTPPEFHLYCTWQVNKSWTKNLNAKIKNLTKRKEIHQKLFKLRSEMDAGTFEEELLNFVSILEADLDLNSFLVYFENEYMTSRHQWAYCYRKHAFVNTNMSMAFHRTLKCKIAQKRKIETLSQWLNVINDYLKYKENELYLKEIRCKRTNKLTYLRSRHKKALEQFEKGEYVIVPMDKDLWYVKFSQDSNSNNYDELYTVEKLDVKECSLYDDISCHLPCTECKICYHEFKCNCPDSAIKCNMCKHIHLLGIFIKDNIDDQCETCETVIEDHKENIKFVPKSLPNELDDDNDIQNTEKPSVSPENEINLKPLKKENLEKRISEYTDEVQKIFDEAETEDQLTYLWHHFIKPMNSKISALKKNKFPSQSALSKKKKFKHRKHTP